jgi:hypothetical protein
MPNREHPVFYVLLDGLPVPNVSLRVRCSKGGSRSAIDRLYSGAE